ncbi:SusC/RagA family TonB-linked outer membrane protein [Flagellimonas taeanensis]|uniref:SusC/RagA family TonB-linked outer membrane protein n=1 Tax=Flavobacteriaceae TaxID=49546 RepID=UPI000E67C0D5|nr:MULTISPECIES: SusC/RagA family TonB-linked outer membrane protein [Allomuricauda]MDC6386141.1 SusC/RagA family TonB-linked outer membrane protein [Muricauda sp. SK9]RIV50372.1 SusC/RagA family TonB-linked outer membrane protein [Allomuricauda taeanensis]
MKKKLILILMLALSSGYVFGQSITVTGSIVDAETNQPVPGVTVLQMGAANGASSDFDGNYSIEVPSNATLRFTAIGYESQEIVVNGRTVINVVMSINTEQLNEVVVTGLGITREKKALGYATATVEAEALTEVATPNIAAALYGRAPGVQISATPGGATSAVNITIRGAQSITGTSTPLIIKDGIPIRNGDVNNGNYWDDQRIRGNGLNDINPEDIESISILKGASAAALYGSEATNGVVLITTKKGKGRGWSADFNTAYNFDRVAYLPEFQNERGPGYPLSISDAGQDENLFLYYDLDGDNVNETRGLIGTTLNFGPRFDGQPTLAWDGKIRPYLPQDSYSGLFNTAHTTRYNTSVSNVTENSNTRFSFTRSDNGSIVPNSSSYKNIFNLNTTINWTEGFRSTLVVDYINGRVNNRPYKIDRLMNNFGGMMSRFDSAEWYKDRYQTSLGYRWVTGANQSLTPDENIIYGGYKEPVLEYLYRANRFQSEERSDRVIGNLTLEWDLADNLTLRGRVSNDFTTEYIENRNPNEVPIAFGNSGYFSMSTRTNSIKYGELLLSYTAQINDDFSLLARLGYNATEQKMRYTSAFTDGGLSVENWFDVAASVNQARQDNDRENLIKDAMIGLLNLDYKGIFYVEGTIRRDRTSTMSPQNNSFIYPSVNSSFILSDAFAMPEAINLLKIRGSWGIVGNYPSIYSANIAYNQNNLGVQGGGSSILYTTLPTDFGNDNIKPEEKHEYEFGVEANLFDNRFIFETTYYNAQIQDQILGLTIPITAGGSSVLSNVGTLRNSGIEVGLTYFPIRGQNVNWELGITGSRQWNKVEKLAPGLDEIIHADYDGNAAQLVSRVGQPMGDLLAHPVATDSQGRKIVDPNGMYKVDPDTLVTVGNAQPKVIGGIRSGLTIKNFSLNVLADYRIGGHVMPTALNWMTSRGLTEESLNYSTSERGGLSYYETNDGTRVQIAANATSGPNGEQVFHDGILLEGVQADGSENDVIVSNPEYYFTVYNWGGPQYSPNTRYELYIQENNYLKLREISLGYSLARKVVDKIGLKSLDLSLFGRNLFYIYRSIKNMDAEQTTAGSNWFQNVNNVGNGFSTRSFGLQVRARL